MPKNNRPLRFCMVTTFYPPYSFGGDAVFVQRLANELARRGHSVEVVHCIDSYRIKTTAAPSSLRIDHPNVTVHSLKSGFGALSPFATHQTGLPLFKTRRLREILDRPFDVIHYHNISLAGGPAVLAYGKGIKLYTTHEYWLVCPTHLLFKFNREPCESKQCLSCGIAHGRPPQWWRYTGLLEQSIRHVDAFIAPTRFAEEIHRRNGLDVPFVHLDSFVPDLPAEDGAQFVGPSQPYFLFVGRLEKVKGLQTLLPLFREYGNAKLVIAGVGSNEGELRRMAGGSANIEFLGFVAEAELQPLYRNSLGVIVPSICYEISPLVIIEAFRQRTPVIARDLGGMAEVVGESGGGLLFKSDAELLAAMDRLSGEPGFRAELGRRGYEAYRERWTAGAHLEGYFDLIGRLAGGEGPGAEG